MLMNLSEVNCYGNERNFPLGWFLNYNDHFDDLHGDKREMKHSQYKKSVIKIWKKDNILKLEKAYDAIDI